MATSPTLVTPVLGTPTSGNLANCTFPTLNQSTTGNAATASAVPYTGLTGTVPTWNQNTTGTAASLSATLAVLKGGTGVTTSTGTGSVVLNTTPTFITPILGTPTSGTLTNCTFPTLNQNTTGTAAGLSAALNATGVNYTSGGTGAVTRTAASKFQETVSVKDFGATGNGVTDDTAAIQAAINYAGTLGVHGYGDPLGATVFFPAGMYNVSSTLNMVDGGVTLCGDGKLSTTLNATGNYGNIIYVNGTNSNAIKNLGFQSHASVAHTTGACIYLNNANAITIRDVEFSATTNIEIWNAITIFSGYNIFIEDTTIIGYSNYGIQLGVAGNTASLTQNVFLTNVEVSGGPSGSIAAIVCYHITGFVFVNVGGINNKTMFLVSPSVGQQVSYGFSYQLAADTSSSNGMIIQNNGGEVDNLNFTDCWASSSTAEFGVVITGNVKSITFTGLRAINNYKAGVQISTTGGISPAYITFNNCQILANAQGLLGNSGYDIGSNVTHFSIIGGVSSNAGWAFAGHQNYGILMSSGCDYYSIIGCDVSSNTTSGILGPTSTNITIEGNIGYITRNLGTASIATTTSSIVVTHGLSSTPTVANIQVTPTSSLAASGVNSFWVSTPTSTTFTINVNANVTTTAMTFAWSARVLGA